MASLLVLHALSTFALTGLIWTVQVVHYPLFASVGKEAFAAYHARHVQRMTIVVAPLMLAEAATATILLFRDPTWRVPALLLLGIWLSTAFVQVPCHRRLEAGQDPAVIRRLVGTNWIRTGLWTARAVLVALAFA